MECEAGCQRYAGDETYHLKECGFYKDSFSERFDKLNTLINNPEIENFLKGVQLESAHQTKRWGEIHEENKHPLDYGIVLDMIKGKLANDLWTKDHEKFQHHLIAIASVCYNMHRQVNKTGTVINAYFDVEE